MYSVRRQISRHAARLRRERTEVENAHWQHLRSRQLAGYKFRFQASIGPFIADFLCIEAMLIVEIDGGQHNAARDARRTAFLESRGYRVIRFWNSDVMENRDGVLEAIHMALNAGTADKTTLTNPLPRRREWAFRFASHG